MGAPWIARKAEAGRLLELLPGALVVLLAEGAVGVEPPNAEAMARGECIPWLVAVRGERADVPAVDPPGHAPDHPAPRKLAVRGLLVLRPVVDCWYMAARAGMLNVGTSLREEGEGEGEEGYAAAASCSWSGERELGPDVAVGLGRNRLGGPVVGALPLELHWALLVGATGALITESGEEAPVAQLKLQGTVPGEGASLRVPSLGLLGPLA